jgi:branched-chain amino acid transport system permease protein
MPLDTNTLLLQLLNGVTLGLLYVLVSSGLTVIFGVTGILNFAHGALYMLGAYIALAAASATGSFWIALIVAPIVVMLVGALLEMTTIRPLYDRDISYQMLLTFGLALIATDGVEFIFQGARSLDTPPIISGATTLGPVVYPTYKLFVIGAAIVVTVLSWIVIRFTDFGLIARAGSQNHGTVRILGINMSRYFTLVFAVGSLLAGIAGVLAAPFVGVTANMGNEIIIVSFIVVILGGLGSFPGALIAGLIIGITQTLGGVLFPPLSGYWIYLALIGTLLVRPQGLFGDFNVREELAKIIYDRNIDPIHPTDRSGLIAIGILAIFPVVAIFFDAVYYVDVLTLMLIWGLLALSLDLVLGFLGLLSFGHAVFIGLGAYITGYTLINLVNSFLVGMVLAVVIVTAIAWLIGALSLRFHGVFFAMITLAIAQMFYQGAINFSDITGGSNGMILPVPKFLGFSLDNAILFYYLTAVIVLAIYTGAVRLLDSPFGRAMVAIREGERRMSFLGYETNKYKQRAFAISGGIGAVSGVLFASYQFFVFPGLLFWTSSGDALFGVILGGMGTLYGPLVGGAVYVGLQQILSTYFEQWRLVLGLILVLVVLFAPRGLVSIYGEIRSRLGFLRDATPTETGQTEDIQQPLEEKE